MDKPDEALLVPCSRLALKAPEDFEQSLMLNDKLLDEYGACRARHDALIEYERKRK